MFKRPLAWSLVALLTVVVGGVGLLHTETDGHFDPTCPACQLQASAVGEPQVLIYLDAITVSCEPVPEHNLSDPAAPSPRSSVHLRAPPLA